MKRCHDSLCVLQVVINVIISHDVLCVSVVQVLYERLGIGPELGLGLGLGLGRICSPIKVRVRIKVGVRVGVRVRIRTSLPPTEEAGGLG